MPAKVRDENAEPRTRLRAGLRAGRRFGILRFVVLISLVVATSVFVGAGAIDQEDSAPSVGDMKSLLKKAILSGDEEKVLEVLRTLARQPGREPAEAVLSILTSIPPSEEDLYWFLLDGVASFNQPGAFSEMGDFVVRYRGETVARDLLHALQKNHSKYMNRVIRRVLRDGPIDLQLMAVDIAARIPVRRTVDVLMPVLLLEEAKEKGGRVQPTLLKRRVLMALRALTFQTMGDSTPNWVGWWEANRHKGLRILREEAEELTPTTGLVQRLDPVREQEFFGLEDLPPGRILVITGDTARNGNDTNFDHIENFLTRLGVAHDLVTKKEASDKVPPLDKYAAIFINCSQINEFCQSPGHTAGAFTGNRLHRCMGPAPHDNATYKLKGKILDRLKRWVEKGGYLFTEDWVMVEFLELVWSKYVESGSSLEDSTVMIRPGRGQTSHSLLRGVFSPPVRIESYDWDEDDEEDEEEEYDPTSEDDPGDEEDEQGGRTGVSPEGKPETDPELEEPQISIRKHKWKIDNESPSIRVKSKKVTILMSSDELRRKVGDKAVAVTFSPGNGKVVHVLSHFGKQNSRADEATLENLMVNFLLELRVRIGGG